MADPIAIADAGLTDAGLDELVVARAYHGRWLSPLLHDLGFRGGERGLELTVMRDSWVSLVGGIHERTRIAPTG